MRICIAGERLPRSGAVHGEVGNFDRAVDLICRAILAHEESICYAHPAFYLSRGLVYLQMGEKEKGNTDLGRFVDQTFDLTATMGMDGALGTLGYARILQGSREERKKELQQIFKALSGENIPMDPKLEAWKDWWNKHGDTFKAGPDVRALSPGGIRKVPDSSGRTPGADAAIVERTP